MGAALIAALAMLLQDITGFLMMQYESNSLSLPPRRRPVWKYWRDYVGGGWKAWAGPILDQLQWMVGITTTTISVTAFGGTTHIRLSALEEWAKTQGYEPK